MPTNIPLSRRRLLAGLGAVGATAAMATLPRTELTAATTDRALLRHAPGYQPWLWNDPRAWADGRVPGPGDVAVIDRPVVVEGNVAVAGVRIGATGALLFSPHASTTLESSGNVVVRGRLVLRPRDITVVHTLRFVGVQENRFVGGGTTVLDSDVGLWVMDAGILDAVGTQRQGWAREWDPSWLDTDEVVRAPIGAGDFFTFRRHAQGDSAPQADPRVPPAELINLTRNVRIEGTPSGRSHVMIHNHHGPQTIRNVAVRYMGVPGAMGRYGLHFHHGFDATRGSLVENVVVRDGGSKGFVPHLSHGIRFHRCVAYDVEGPGYWWDPPEDFRSDDPVLRSESNDILYDHCLAGRIGVDSDGRSGLSGFVLMAGVGNAAVGCVSVGVGGLTNSSGFNWPANANHSANVWRMEDCVSHNNKNNGVFVWQNDNNPHVVDRLTTYNNSKAGIEQGAYANPYAYRDCVILDGTIQHSNARTNSATGLGAGHQRSVIGGLTPLIYSMLHKLTAGDDLLFRECVFTATPVIELDERIGSSNASAPAHYLFDRCMVNNRDMEPSDVVVKNNEAGTTVRGVRRNGTTWRAV